MGRRENKAGLIRDALTAAVGVGFAGCRSSEKTRHILAVTLLLAGCPTPATPTDVGPPRSDAHAMPERDAGPEPGSPDARADAVSAPDTSADAWAPPGDGSCAAPIVLAREGTPDGRAYRASGSIPESGTEHGTGSCGYEPTGDIVYAYTATETGSFFVDLVGPAYSGLAVHVRSACDDATTELACLGGSAELDADRATTLLEAEAGHTYFVFVDRLFSTPGDLPFEIRVGVPTPLVEGRLCQPLGSIVDACVAGTRCLGEPGAERCTAFQACGAGSDAPSLDELGTVDADGTIRATVTTVGQPDGIGLCEMRGRDVVLDWVPARTGRYHIAATSVTGNSRPHATLFGPDCGREMHGPGFSCDSTLHDVEGGTHYALVVDTATRDGGDSFDLVVRPYREIAEGEACDATTRDPARPCVEGTLCLRDGRCSREDPCAAVPLAAEIGTGAEGDYEIVGPPTTHLFETCSMPDAAETTFRWIAPDDGVMHVTTDAGGLQLAATCQLGWDLALHSCGPASSGNVRRVRAGEQVFVTVESDELAPMRTLIEFHADRVAGESCALTYADRDARCSPGLVCDRGTCGHADQGCGMDVPVVDLGTLAAGTTMVPGDTLAGPDLRYLECAENGISGAELTFALRAPTDGFVTATVTTREPSWDSWGPRVSLQRDCVDRRSTESCIDLGWHEGSPSAFVRRGDTLFVVVDGRATAGLFDLALDVTPATALGAACEPGRCVAGATCRASVCVADVCGDGAPGEHEGCDDGGRIDGDGCSSTCELEPSAAAPRCEDATTVRFVPASGGLAGRATASTIGGPATATSCGSEAMPAVFHRFTLADTRDVEVRVRPEDGFDALLEVRPACGDAALGCADGYGTDIVSLPALPAGEYVVVVSGLGPVSFAPRSSGAYDLEIDAVAP